MQLLQGLQHDIEKVTPHAQKADVLEIALSELLALGRATDLYVGEFYGAFSRLGYVLAGGKLPYVAIDDVAFCCASACTKPASEEHSFAAWLRAARSHT